MTKADLPFLVFVVLVLGLGVGAPLVAAFSDTSNSYQLWEYQDSPAWEAKHMGQLGWELVAVVPDGKGGARLLYKRPRGPLTEAEQQAFVSTVLQAIPTTNQ